MKLKDNILRLFNTKEVEVIQTSIANNKATKNFFEIEHKMNYRINSSIKKWRDALNYAEEWKEPNRNGLYEIYDEVLLDAVVKNSMDLRTQRIMSIPFSIVGKNDKVNKKAQDIFDSYWFEKYMKFAMESIFFGHSLIQIDGADRKGVTDVTLIPRENVIPEYGLFKKNEYDRTDAGMNYMQPKIYKWLCEVYHTRRDLGLLNMVASSQISKKVGIIAWTQFVEKFGEPMVIGRTNSNLESEREALQEFLGSLSMNTSAVLDKQTEIEYKEAVRPDVYNVYKELINQMNDDINTVILGGTELTSGSSGGSEARAKIHQAESNHKTAADIRFIKNNINNVLIPKLESLKIIPRGLKFKFDDGVILSMEDKINVDKELFKHFKLTKDYIELTYNVELEEDEIVTPEVLNDIENEMITEDNKVEDGE